MEIGSVKMRFTEEKKLDSVTFQLPDTNFMGVHGFYQVDSCMDEQELIRKSDSILAGFYEFVNCIELFDPTTEVISKVPYNVSRFPDGTIREMTVVYKKEKK